MALPVIMLARPRPPDPQQPGPVAVETVDAAMAWLDHALAL
jgi:hypothetical protein